MPERLPLRVFLSTAISDASAALAFWVRCMLASALWAIALPTVASYALRASTLCAEVVPSNNTLLLEPKKVFAPLLELRTDSPLFWFPKGASDAIPWHVGINPLKLHLLICIGEGLAFILTLFLAFFVVMIVREWILQHEELLIELRQRQQELFVDMRMDDDRQDEWEDIEPDDADAAHDEEFWNAVRADRVPFAGVDDIPVDDEIPMDDFDGLLAFTGLRGPLWTLIGTNLVAHVFLVCAVLILYFLPYVQGRALVSILGSRIVPLVRGWYAVCGAVWQIAEQEGWWRLLPRNYVKGPPLSPEHIALLQGAMQGINDTWVPPTDSMNFRIFGTFVGYSVIGLLGAIYVKSSAIRGAAGGLAGFSGVDQAEKIMKIIIIIGIELVVFPIYCGTLLHMSILPLMEDTSFSDFVNVIVEHTAVVTVLHWAMGTCYMFVFAMFVTMCRQIMRPGVLYFVRDPGDPDFHPIKDALERQLLSQLKKIGISGLIYSALILVCIGQVISVLRYRIGVSFLPLQLMPQISAGHQNAILPLLSVYLVGRQVITVREIKRITLLKRYWKWAFVAMCRHLRLSSFIMNDPVPQEQGSVRYGSLSAMLRRAQPDYTKPLTQEQFAALEKDPDAAYFVKDGCFVRAPSTDSIQSPVDTSVKMFIVVNKDDERLDGLSDDNPGQPEIREYTIVYVPPHFRWRIALLLCYIWMFSIAAVGSATVLPLLVGKALCSLLLPASIAQFGDVFHFYVGAVPLLSLLVHAERYTSFKQDIASIASRLGFRTVNSAAERQNGIAVPGRRQAAKRLMLVLSLVVQCCLVSGLISMALKRYIEFPLQKAFDPSAALDYEWKYSVPSGAALLHLAKVAIVDRHPEWTLARNYRRIFGNGIWSHDHLLAMRKIFIPAYVGLVYALAMPVALGWIVVGATKYFTDFAVPQAKAEMLYIAAYPVFVLMFILMVLFNLGKRQFSKWIARMRDEVYLVGERLHNVNPPDTGVR